MAITKENAINALKKALAHKKESTERFEEWLREKGIEGNVLSL